MLGVRRERPAATSSRPCSTAHRYTDGLDFVEQGTPTNATETAAPTIDLDHPDLAAVRAAELDDGKGSRRRRPAAGATRFPLPIVPATATCTG